MCSLLAHFKKRVFGISRLLECFIWREFGQDTEPFHPGSRSRRIGEDPELPGPGARAREWRATVTSSCRQHSDAIRECSGRTVLAATGPNSRDEHIKPGLPSLLLTLLLTQTARRLWQRGCSGSLETRDHPSFKVTAPGRHEWSVGRPWRGCLSPGSVSSC